MNVARRLDPSWRTALEQLQPGELRFDEPLAPWCSIRAGGHAEALVRPASPQQLVELLKLAHAGGIPVSTLGGGANTLVGDGGVPGITLKLPADFVPEQLEPGRITLGGGSAITRLITVMKQQQRVGAEFLAGIPGTLGGAVTMNAGTKHGECMSIVEAVELATPAGLGWVDAAQLPHEYRHTSLPPGAIVTRVRFVLPEGDLEASKAQMDLDLAYRKRTQPLSQPNFGSVFTNPKGDFAGRLIEAVQLKGHTLGRAQFSMLHANWIVNLGGATAADVTALMDLATLRVREAHGIALHPEVKRIGVFL
ncbi:MAG: murB [Myxococcaceae bacterium]|nr:murB [Myxococcaceae bacterium]